jgi:protein-S-isoprenylcysteine O-methyltransferase Ste14
MPQHWPGLLVGLIVGTYWARVIRLVIKQRRKKSSANFVPPEPLGRTLRLVWYPIVALWVALPIYSAFRSAYLYHLPLLEWIGVALAAAALIATILCWKRMGKSWRMGINPDEKTQLIVTGPYAYVRHPIYALSSLLMIASFLAVPTIPMLLIAVVHCALLQWEARREERYLLSVHGQAYQDYLAQVGRFIPRVAP